jgi:hypothetical protein
VRGRLWTYCAMSKVCHVMRVKCKAKVWLAGNVYGLRVIVVSITHLAYFTCWCCRLAAAACIRCSKDHANDVVPRVDHMTWAAEKFPASCVHQG